MLTGLSIQNMTVFQEADFAFSPGLNVVVGENASGKTHFLKAGYCIAAALAAGGRQLSAEAPSKTYLQSALAEKLVNVFRPESLGRIVRRRQGRERCEMAAQFADIRLNTSFSFATQSKSEVSLEQVPGRWSDITPAYIPTREVLSLYPNFVSVYEKRYLEFEESYRDLCLLLGDPALRGPRENRIKELLKPLEEAMGGTIFLDKNGRFYLKISGQGNMEMPLVAEGIRKLAMMARLIMNGTLVDRGMLFWDEPDTSLNPKLITHVARFIMALAQSGVQVLIASHSLFLLRELEILRQSRDYRNTPARFFALHPEEQGVSVQTGDALDDLDPIVSLDEELSQSDRYMEVQ
ncbi:MAG: AAA family ATPase [Desulfobacterales bacterium]